MKSRGSLPPTVAIWRQLYVKSAHRLHVSVLNAFGAEVDTFGSADDGTGPLPGVV